MMRPTHTPARVVLQLRRAVVLGHFGLRVPAGPAGWVNHSIFSTTHYSTNQATPCGISLVVLLLICNIGAISPHNVDSLRSGLSRPRNQPPRIFRPHKKPCSVPTLR